MQQQTVLTSALCTASVTAHHCVATLPAPARSVYLLTDDADALPVEVNAESCRSASAVSWSPDGAVLAVAVSGVQPREDPASQRSPAALSATAHQQPAELGRGGAETAVLLYSASGAPVHTAKQPAGSAPHKRFNHMRPVCRWPGPAARHVTAGHMVSSSCIPFRSHRLCMYCAARAKRSVQVGSCAS